MTEQSKTLSLLTVLVALATLACASSSIEARGNSRYAPVNEQRGGSLTYVPQQRSRESLYEEMYRYCHGAYEIANERTTPISSTTTFTRNQIISHDNVQATIDFRCVDAPESHGARAVTSVDDWEVARDAVRGQSGCAATRVVTEVAAAAPGARTFSLDACGRAWLCNVANHQAACSGQAASPAALPPPPPQPPPSWPAPPNQL